MTILSLTKVFKKSLLWDINLHYDLLLNKQKRNIIESTTDSNQIFCTYTLELLDKEGAYPNHFDLETHKMMFEIVTKWVDHGVFDISSLPKLD